MMNCKLENLQTCCSLIGWRDERKVKTVIRARFLISSPLPAIPEAGQASLCQANSQPGLDTETSSHLHGHTGHSGHTGHAHTGHSGHIGHGHLDNGHLQTCYTNYHCLVVVVVVEILVRRNRKLSQKIINETKRAVIWCCY